MNADNKSIDICERTFQFAVRVAKVCQFLYGKGGIGKTLGTQLLRSGTSIGANVEEARAGQSKADFISKNSIALKEARETNYRVRLLIVADVVPQSRLSSLLTESQELMKIIGAIIVSSKRTR